MAKYDSKLLSLIARALQEKPTLALVFGICLLGFFLTSGALAVQGLSGERAFPAYIAFLVFLVGGLFSAVMVGREMKAPRPIKTDDRSPSLENDSTAIAVFSTELKPILSSMSQAVRFKNEVFVEEIRRECSNFAVSADHWAQGRLSVPPSHYNAVLLKLYESARKSVFCTSFTEYRSTWQSELGNLIIRAHQKAGAKVTRVFVFDKFEDVTPTDVEAMEIQAKHSIIDVLVFIDQEYPAFDFPPDVTRDFTIIDDKEVIGITSSFGQSKLAADWYFENEAKFKNLNYIQESVIRGSRRFEEFIKTRWKGSSH